MSKLPQSSLSNKPNIPDLLDVCRGFAIVIAVLFHFTDGGWFGWQGVHIFLILSGFGLTYSCLKKRAAFSWREWYAKRFQRILPAYYFVALLGFLVINLVALLSASQKYGGLTILMTSLKKLVLDLLLLRGFFHDAISAYPNPPLWFIPLIVSFYLGFPWLVSQFLKCKTTTSYLLFFLATASVEFIYRAISLYLLDGLPISYEEPFLPFLHHSSSFPLDKLGAQMPFQGEAPFGFFPSRLAEFALGMLGAAAIAQNTQKCSRYLLNAWAATIGIIIWLFGNVLIYLEPIGWIFSDLLIAIGIILWSLNLAWLIQQKSSFLSRNLAYLGVWSYHIFLTHYLFIYIYDRLGTKQIVSNESLNSLLVKLLAFAFVVAGTALTSWLVVKFEQSKLTKFVFQRNLVKLPAKS